MIKISSFALIIILILMINISLFLGQYQISFDEYLMFLKKLIGLNSLIDDEKYETMKSIIFDIRLPRIISAILIGASLAVAGASFQAMFVNPLVSPGILGVLSGASFGAALGMILGLNWFLMNLSTFIFGILAVFFCYYNIFFIYSSSRNMIILVLGGLISSSLFSALLSHYKIWEQIQMMFYLQLHIGLWEAYLLAQALLFGI